MSDASRPRLAVWRRARLFVARRRAYVRTAARLLRAVGQQCAPFAHHRAPWLRSRPQ